MRKESRIYVAGHSGLVGAALCRKLKQDGYMQVICRTHHELDLREQLAVRHFFSSEKPDYVFLAAAKVGGIMANSRHPADFIRDNLLIQDNVINAAQQSGVRKLLFLGSSCIYPKHAPQPIQEDSLLTGPLEPTNQWYAVAKIAGIKLCQALQRQYGFHAISVMPTNLYGPGDNFDLESSHVLPALLRKFHDAQQNNKPTVTVWGSGKPRREFLHVDDLADACIFLMQKYEQEDIVNIGVGEDLTITDLATLIQEIVGYEGEILYDTSKPDGTPRKLLDVSRLRALGWYPTISLREGIAATYE